MLILGKVRIRVRSEDSTQSKLIRFSSTYLRVKKKKSKKMNHPLSHLFLWLQSQLWERKFKNNFQSINKQNIVQHWNDLFLLLKKCYFRKIIFYIRLKWSLLLFLCIKSLRDVDGFKHPKIQKPTQLEYIQ